VSLPDIRLHYLYFVVH